MAEKEKLSLHKWQGIMGIENMKDLSLSHSCTQAHMQRDRTDKQVDQDDSL